MTTSGWIQLVVTLPIVGAVALFAFQNWTRVSDVSLNYGLGMVRTSDPLPIPALLGLAFLVGLLGGVWMWMRERWSSSRRIQDLQGQLARAGVSNSSGRTPDDWT